MGLYVMTVTELMTIELIHDIHVHHGLCEILCYDCHHHHNHYHHHYHHHDHHHHHIHYDDHHHYNHIIAYYCSVIAVVIITGSYSIQIG